METFEIAVLIAAGLDDIHRRSVIMGLINPWNICMDGNTSLYLDMVYPINTHMQSVNVSRIDDIYLPYIGTCMDNIAPEIHRGDTFSESSDWWAFGTIIYELIYGIPPFYHQNRHTLYNMKISDKGISFPDTIPVSKNLKNLLSDLLNPDPRHRLGWKGGFEEIKTHPWFIFRPNTQDMANIDWKDITDPSNRILMTRHDEHNPISINAEDKLEGARCTLIYY